MSTIGVNFQIDLDKLDELRFHIGKKGTLRQFQLFFLNSEPDKYGQNGGIKQADTKEERDAGIKLPFVGNAKTILV